MKNIKKKNLRGMTMLEIMIAMGMLAILSLTAASLFVAIVRLEKSNRSILLHAMAAQKVQQTIREWGTTAFQLITEDGQAVEIVHPNGRRSIMRYEDDDGDWRTIRDNRIIFIRDNTEPDNVTVLASQVTPVDAVNNNGTNPIFLRYNNNTPGDIFSQGPPAPDANAPLLIQFVLGDYTRDKDAACHAVTGPGFQSTRVNTSISPRNSI
jgi:prepilin-type N-terminal cleavage/methylation domain-containing protein